VANSVNLGSSSAFYDGKTAVYADFHNWDLLDVVRRVLPRGGRVLDVGCASGGLLEQLRGLAGHRAGLELSPVAATAASALADEVVCGGIDDLAVEFPSASFDVIVCADVLEHLAEPTAAIERVTGWLAPGGVVVTCVPNIANWQARLRLARGIWRYEACGIWDSGHLRFFTLATLRELLEGASLEVESVDITEQVTYQLPVLARLPGPALRVLERRFRRIASRRPELLAFELVCTARKAH